METLVVLVHLILNDAYEYTLTSDVKADWTYNDFKTCENELDKFELDFKKQDLSVTRWSKHTLRVHFEKKEINIYRCLLIRCMGGLHTL